MMKNYAVHNYPLSHSLNVLILLLFTTVMSCSLFDTREPEEPGPTTGPGFIQPDQPSAVIENLTNAVRGINLTNYLRCLHEASFTYEPSSAAQSSNPGIWQGWGYNEERDYFNNLRAEAEGLSGHDLSFENEALVDQSEGEAQYEADYALTIRHESGADLEELRGSVILHMIRDESSGDWVISSWIDRGSGTTWSDLRAAFLR